MFVLMLMVGTDCKSAPSGVVTNTYVKATTDPATNKPEASNNVVKTQFQLKK
jgi:hypothetical protein